MNRALLRPGQSIRGERSDIAVVEWIGEGSYARVYRGEAPEGPAAIKLAKCEVEGAVDRLRQERQVHAAVRHPAVPELQDAGELPASDGGPGVPWLAVRWVPGETLRRRLERHRSLPLVQAVAILLRLADAVATLHASGWTHGDLRPDNVLLETDTHHAYLLDLGEAVPMPVTRRQATILRGKGQTRGASEPEELAERLPIACRLSPESDARQLGELLAWSLTGHDPVREPDRLSIAAGYHPAVVQLWHEARQGYLSTRDLHDRLQRLARQLGFPAAGRR